MCIRDSPESQDSVDSNPQGSPTALALLRSLLLGLLLFAVGLIPAWITLYGATRSIGSTDTLSFDLLIYGIPAAALLGAGALVVGEATIALIRRRRPHKVLGKTWSLCLFFAPGLSLLFVVLAMGWTS